MNLPAVGVASLAIVVAARVFRARLPRGAAEGAFCAAITGAAIAATNSWPADFWQSHYFALVTFAVISLLWVLSSYVTDVAGASARSATFEKWGVFCGVLATGLMLMSVQRGFMHELESRTTTQFLVYVLLSSALLAHSPPLRAITGLLGLTAVIWPMMAELSVRQVALPPVGLLIAAIAVLSVDLLDVLLAWRSRRREWLRDPNAALQPDRKPIAGWLYEWLGFFSAAGLLALLPHPLTPLSFATLAVAGFVSAHRRAGFGAALGTHAAVLTIVSIVLAWFPGAVSAGEALIHPKSLIALGVAVYYLDWLRRFWDQQLLDGKPWTTAGRLIPAVGWGSVGTGYGAIAVAVAVLLGHRSSIEASPVVAVMAGLACVAAAFRLLRPPCHVPHDAVAFCAWPLGLIGAMLVAESAEIWWEGGAFRWLLPALSGVLLAIRSARTARVTGTNAGMMSWWIGSAPATAVLAATAFAQWRTAFFVAAALLVTGLSAWTGVRVARREVVRGSN